MPRRVWTDEQKQARKEYSREYSRRPEVKAKARRYYLENCEKLKARNKAPDRRAYMLEYRQRPEAKQRNIERGRWRRGFPMGLAEQLLVFQGNLCAVCKRPFDISKPRTIHADHCHDTIQPRGMLCSDCNHAEGNILRTGLTAQEFAKRLVAYLENPPAKKLAAKAGH